MTQAQTQEDEQPEQKALHSLVYIFSVQQPTPLLLAVHVPQHTVALSNTALRSMVCTVANVLPDVNVPLATMHWVSQPAREGVEPGSVFSKRLELNLAETGSEAQMLELRKQAESGASYFANLLSSVVYDAMAAVDQEGHVLCAAAEVRYNTEEELVGGAEVAIYSAPGSHPTCAGFRQLVALCDAHSA